MTNSVELRAHLEAGIKELEADVVKLRAALTALDGNGAAKPRAPRQTRRRPRQSSRQPDVVPAGKLSAMLKSSDGLSTAELARRTNGQADQVLQMLKELEQAGKARRTGQRRSTRWHANGGRRLPAARARKSNKPKTEAKLAAALDPVVAS
jgi:hypothetical protein